MTLIVSTPIIFTVDYKKPGSRAKVSEQFGDFVDVEVREIDASEAPIAMRWGHGHVDEAIDGYHETRWFEGRHYAPVSSVDEEGRVVAVGFDAFCEMALKGHKEANLLCQSGSSIRKFLEANGGSQPISGRAIRPFSQIEAGKIERSNRENVVAAAQRLADKILFIDGQAWCSCSEPVLHISRGQKEDAGRAFVNVLVRDSDSPYTSSMSLYRADREGDAVDHMISLGYERDQVSAPNMDVFIADSIAFEDDVPAIIIAAESIVRWTRGSILEGSRDAMAMWADMRDAAKIAEESYRAGTCTTEHIDTLVDAFAAFSATGHAWGDEAELINATVERWRLRPIAHDVGEAPGPNW